ncbi:MAG: class A beta-lactamase-related serine hydrolase [Chloroflexota bacterium]|nr:class A beta-lactamase-related serine hydrolase [Chloroflexota bacterium]
MSIETVASEIERLADATGGIVGVAATQLATGRHIGYREDELFPTASVIKLPLLVTLYEDAIAGRIDLSERVTYRDDTKVAGSGVLQYLEDGLAPTLRDLSVLMMSVSDNTATDLLFDRVGKPRIEATMDRLGLPSIRAPFDIREMLMELVDMDHTQPGGYDELRRLLRVSAGSGGRSMIPDQADRTTPADMCRLLGLIESRAILDADACTAIIELMKRIQSATRIPGLLPKGTVVAHKTGSYRRLRNDVGIVYPPNGPYVVALFARELARDNVDDDGALARISLAVYEEFAD